MPLLRRRHGHGGCAYADRGLHVQAIDSGRQPPNAVSASMATTRSSSWTWAKIDPTLATTMFRRRVGGVVVMDHKPGRR
jgi:hypothetical protein